MAISTCIVWRGLFDECPEDSVYNGGVPLLGRCVVVRSDGSKGFLTGLETMLAEKC